MKQQVDSLGLLCETYFECLISTCKQQTITKEQFKNNFDVCILNTSIMFEQIVFHNHMEY